MNDLYDIMPIKNYPDNGDHVEVVFKHYYPLRITKGEDQWFFKDTKGIQRKNNVKLFVVYSYTISGEDFDFQIKQFLDVDNAILYAINQYKKYLKVKIKQTREVISHE